MTATSDGARRRLVVPALVAVAALPLLVAAVAQRGIDWHPVFDMAMTELRVRDVGGAHTPLIGLQGRIGPDGSHPGPLSFYLLAPVYRLLGSSAWALQASTAVFNVGAVATAVAIAARRRSTLAPIAVTGALLALMVGYGFGPLTEPWNPHLPVLWFVAVLVSAWAVLDGDPPALVALVATASVCAQTHVPYLAVTSGVVGGTVALALVARRVRVPGPDLRWLLAAAGVGLLLWAPPLVDQLTNEPGNLSKIVDHLGTPEASPIGIREGVELTLAHLDGWHLVAGAQREPGVWVDILSGPGPEPVRGGITLALWAVAALASVALRHRRLLALHAVVAGAVLVAAVAISRIHGIPWPYLMLWGYGITALLLLSVAATAVVVARRSGIGAGPGTERALRAAALSVVALLAVRAVLLALDARPGTPMETAQLGRIAPDVAAALESGVGAATGDDGRYLVRWYDATLGGSEGIGLVNELVRQGFDIGVDATEGTKIGPHRVRSESEATAIVVLASGGWIDEVAGTPGAVSVAADDHRPPGSVADFAEERAAAIDALRRTGQPELIDLVDRDLFGLALNHGIEPEVAVHVGRMIDIGVPVEAFIVPTGELP